LLFNRNHITQEENREEAFEVKGSVASQRREKTTASGNFFRHFLSCAPANPEMGRFPAFFGIYPG
jgi:hypothetical protein